MKHDLNYNEGDLFLIPLECTEYAIGVVARANHKGVVIGYFFGPYTGEEPAPEAMQALKPEDAATVLMCGDLKLLRNEWVIVGHLKNWCRSNWPIPRFGRIDDILNLGVEVEISDDSRLEVVRESQTSTQAAASLPPDGLFGAIAVESFLRMRVFHGRNKGDA